MSGVDQRELQLIDRIAKAAERERIRELRQRRIPWPHIAQQLGRSEIDLRRRYDRTGFA